jgi:hypothetical protein
MSRFSRSVNRRSPAPNRTLLGTIVDLRVPPSPPAGASLITDADLRSYAHLHLTIWRQRRSPRASKSSYSRMPISAPTPTSTGAPRHRITSHFHGGAPLHPRRGRHRGVQEVLMNVLPTAMLWEVYSVQSSMHTLVRLMFLTLIAPKVFDEMSYVTFASRSSGACCFSVPASVHICPLL